MYCSSLSRSHSVWVFFEGAPEWYRAALPGRIYCFISRGDVEFLDNTKPNWRVTRAPREQGDSSMSMHVIWKSGT